MEAKEHTMTMTDRRTDLLRAGRVAAYQGEGRPITMVGLGIIVRELAAPAASDSAPSRAPPRP